MNPKNRISFCLLHIQFLTASLFVLDFVYPKESVKPNFIVFLVDDLGYMDTGVNNPNSFYETPNINQLAATGMSFTEGYAANPVCSPTRYSLMTGKYPTRAMATNWFSGKRSGKFNPAPLKNQMELSEITLAEILKKKGYVTFFAGKWHLGPTKEFWPKAQGFDINMGGHSRGGPYTGNKYFAPFQNPELHPDSPEGEHLPNRLAEETVKFIHQNKNKPFLVYLSFYSVHTPLLGRIDLVKKYKERAKKISGQEFGPLHDSKVRVIQKHAIYAAMVEAMDDAVGKVLKALDDARVSNNTFVVFTSDNGGLSTSEGSPTSNFPLKGGKGWVYEGGIREPWIIRYPGVTPMGSISKEKICSIDLFPTIAAAVGIKVQHQVDGIDLMPALRGGKLQREALFWHYPHYSNQGGIPGGAIRIGDFKLLENYENGSVSLYNLKEDLGERKDLSQYMPEKTKELQKKLHAWYKEVNAKFLQPKGDSGQPWRPN
jgi:arylsulfatase A-like enzyme